MREPDSPLRVGIIGTDNGHAHAFAAFVNGWHEDVPLPFRSSVGGGTPTPHVHRWGNTLRYLEQRAPHRLGRGRTRITAIWSADGDDAALTARACEIDDVCEHATEVVERVDAVMVLSEDPAGHLGHAAPALERGIPTYVDKPMAASLAEANAMYDLAEEHGAPLFSGSGMRFSPEILAMRDEASRLVGDVSALHVHCPVTIPLFGIHGVEITILLVGHDVHSVDVLTGPGRQAFLLSFTSGATSLVDHVDIPGDPRYLGAVHGDLGSIQFRSADLGRNLLAYAHALEDFFLTGSAPADRHEVLSIVEISIAAAEALRTGARVELSIRCTH